MPSKVLDEITKPIPNFYVIIFGLKSDHANEIDPGSMAN